MARTKKLPRKQLFYVIPLLLGLFVIINMASLYAQESLSAPLSGKTRVCLGCHARYNPGIVEGWQTSRHSRTTPAQALERPDLERRVSAEAVPEELAQSAVGCYECHGLNTEQHTDSFNHMGIEINVVVSPKDCKTCHPVEVEQYSGSKKFHAYKNLMENPVYHTLLSTVTGVKTVEEDTVSTLEPSQETLNGACLGCHGSIVEVDGMITKETKMGKVKVPNLMNWPNQGVGRVNPDGSLGSCTSCHTRHGFSIAEARKPYTCSQCHGEPDVPAWPVYKVSKHGNIFSAHHQEWNFDSVPWEVGKDFTTPTCATCHNSLLTSSRNEIASREIIAERTHDFGARLYTRIFGLIYSHPQPKSGDTTIIQNADGLPLPTTFLGKPASEFLIDAAEQQTRLANMKNVCKSCHSTAWVDQHFARFEHTAAEVDQMVLAATALMANAWEKGLADNSNPFDEAIEQRWIKQWLFYANTIRYASAMTGAQKYSAFTDGWWELTNNLQEMKDWIAVRSSK